MSKSRKTPSASRESIAQALRDEIVSKRLAPGTRLQTRLELTERFQSSIVTVQRALERLTEEGFITAHGRNGTLVSEAPPHEAHYALVFPSPENKRDWVRFWTALTLEARRINTETAKKIHIFHNIDEHEETPDCLRLLELTGARRLAGVIFSNPPRAPGLLKKLAVGRVAIASNPLPGVGTVTLDTESFWIQALDYLRARGRTDIAVLSAPWPREDLMGRLSKLMSERGLRLRPEWIQTVTPGRTEWAAHVTHLLMLKDRRELPNGMIIADDNMAEAASTGLVTAGIRVPDELEVVAHCNFPYPTPSVLPVKRLGYDARKVLMACMEVVDRQRTGDDISTPVSISAAFGE